MIKVQKQEFPGRLSELRVNDLTLEANNQNLQAEDQS